MLNNIVGVLAPTYSAPPNSYESIATVTIGAGGSATASFTSIPSTYKHLQLRALFQSATGGEQLVLRFNSDASSANYTLHQLSGDGSAAGSAGWATGTFTGARTAIKADSNAASYFGGGVADILDYQNTSKYKTVRSLGGSDINAAGGSIIMRSALWLNTAAISSIDCVVSNGSNMNQYTKLALYGIKG